MVRRRISLVPPRTQREEEMEEETSDSEIEEVSDMEESSSENSENENENESEEEYEESSSRKKKKKARGVRFASKKKMTNLSGGRTKLRTGKVGDGKRIIRSNKRKQEDGTSVAPRANESIIVRNEDANSMFATVRKSYDAIDATVNEWIGAYEENAQEAIASLLTFVIHSSGCVRGTIRVEDYNPDVPEKKGRRKRGDDESEKGSQEEKSKRLNERIDELVDLLPATDDYPIVSSHSTFKQFDKHYATFWSILIENCSGTIIFEEKFSHDFLHSLNTISKHSVRSFRHTATLTAYLILDQLIHTIKNQKKQISKAEKRKNRKMVAQLNEEIEIMEEIISNIVQLFFEQRFKDTAPDIRGLGVESLGGWILKHPDKFLADQYLRYLGWLLADKHAGVRELVLKQLLKIYAKEEWHGQLNKFTKRYLPRFVEISTEDISVPVSILGIQFVTQLLQNGFFEGVPKEDEYISSIESLLFDENSLRRQSVSDFIQAKLALNMQQKNRRRSTGSRSKKQTVPTLTLDDYLGFINQYSASVPNVASHVVDNFWETNLFIQWKEMTDKLINGNSNDNEEEDLIKMLRASVQKLYLQGESLFVTGADSAATKGKKSKNDEHQGQMDDMTAHLAKTLPVLLKNYQSEKNKVLPLLEIPQFFFMESYDTHQLQQNFDELISLLKSLFWKHTNVEIHSNIAKTFSHLLNNQDYSLHDRAKQYFDTLIREMEEKLIEAISQFEENQGSDNENQETLAIALQRISTFVSVSDIQVGGIVYQLMRLLRARGDGAHIQDASTQSIMNILFTTLCYRFNELVKQKEKSMSVTYEELYNNAMEFKSYLIRIVRLSDESEYELRLFAFYRYCDLVSLFNMYAKGSTLRSLSLLCNSDEVETISDFFQFAIEKEMKKSNLAEDESVDESNVDPALETRKRFLIASISRLITVGDWDSSISKYILSYFGAGDKSIHSSVKYLWKNLKERDSYNAAQFEVDAMKVLFEKYSDLKRGFDPMDTQDSEETQTDTTPVATDAKIEIARDAFLKLGAKFAQSHFPGLNADLVESVLRDAIIFSFTSKSNIEFLNGFTRHISRLDGSSIQHIKDFFQQQKRQLPAEMRDDESVSKVIEEFQEQLQEFASKKKTTETRGARAERRDDAMEDDNASYKSDRSATRQLQFHTDSEHQSEAPEDRSIDEAVPSDIDDDVSKTTLEAETGGRKRKRESEEPSSPSVEEAEQEAAIIGEEKRVESASGSGEENTQESEIVSPSRRKRRRLT